MRSALTRLFVLFIAVIWIVGPTGCNKADEKPNPELEIPDVPAVSSKEAGKKAPEKK